MFRFISIVCGLLAIALTPLRAAAPRDVTKAASALVHVYTYDATGHLLGQTNGVLLGTDGTALADYASFRRAYSAQIVTSTGSKTTVQRIAGANDLYNLIKLTTGPALPGLSLAADVARQGAQLFVLTFNGKKTEAQPARVAKVEAVSGGQYYTLSVRYDHRLAGCPVVNEKGELVAMVQSSSKPTEPSTYAVSASMGANLKVSALAFGNVSLQSLPMPRCLPEGEKNASTYIFLLGQTATDSLIHISALNDFIAAYPQNVDGYTERAKFRAAHKDFAGCEADIQAALEHSTQKDMPHYALSRLIYQNVLYGTSQSYPQWTLDAALEQANQAYAAQPLPLYALQQGQCLYGLKRYAEAYDRYATVCRSPIASAETFFYAAQACTKMGGARGQVIALLDSAIHRLPTPYAASTAPYFWERAKQYADSGLYRQAVLDLNEYEHLIGYRNLNDKFYYMREQAAVKGHLYQTAVDDINRCVALKPNDYEYNVEKAALQLQLGQTDEALVAARKAVALNPQAADAYKVLGIAYGESKQKRQAIENLQKAKQLGDTTVEELIKRYR